MLIHSLGTCKDQHVRVCGKDPGVTQQMSKSMFNSPQTGTGLGNLVVKDKKKGNHAITKILERATEEQQSRS